MIVVCMMVPRLALLAALGDRRALLDGPVALAPEAGGEQRVGEASASAEAFGVAAGMLVGEALTRCPELRLVPPDPEAVRVLWAGALDRLEGIGAQVESDRPGAAFFTADGLRRLHGGRVEDVLGAVRRAFTPHGGRRWNPVTERGAPTPPGASLELGPLSSSVRLGAGPCRFVAHVAATRARPGRRGRRVEAVVTERGVRSFLAAVPVSSLRSRPELDRLPEVLERLGIRTLGQLAELPAPAVAERFGHPGLLALELAQGRDTPLEPRRPPEPVAERVELPEAVSGPQLERALELLAGRVLGRRERRGRTLRSLAVSARLVEGGTWRRSVTLRRASADPGSLRLALAPRLAELPSPASSLGLEVEAFGPPAHDQGRLVEEVDPRAARRARLGEAVDQARRAAGDAAALRVMDVDPDSRVAERRSVLAPYPTTDPEGS